MPLTTASATSDGDEKPIITIYTTSYYVGIELAKGELASKCLAVLILRYANNSSFRLEIA